MERLLKLKEEYRGIFYHHYILIAGQLPYHVWARRGYYLYKTNNTLSDKLYYNINKDIKCLIDKGIVSETIGTAVKPMPIEYKNIHKHARKRMDKRNVTENDAKGFIINSKVMFKQNNGQKNVYYSNEGVAAVALNEKLLVTVFSHNDYDEGAKAIMEVANKYGI